jgi:putative transposase
MIIRKGYKYRLQTKPETRETFAQFAGACRFVWNKVVALNEGRYQAGVPRLTYGDAAGALPLWKQSEEYGFLADVHSQVLQQCLKDLDRAYMNLFAGRAEPPTFRKKFLNDAFRFPQGFKVDGNRVYLPKIGWVPFWKSRDIDGTIKNVTVSRRGEHWYVSFQVEMDVPVPLHTSDSAIGIDMGVVTFAATSDGQLIKPLNSFRKWETKLAKEQRKLSLKVKFSNNWIKQKRKVNWIHQRIANLRHDFLHQHSTEISQNHAVIVVEDLRVSNMSRSAKDTLDEPGRNVAAKSGLNKAILDQGWGMFRTMLEYKQLWRGGMVIAIPPQYTSQTCAECGHVSPENRVSQAVFSCVACGHTDHADVNAARNILAAGLVERLNACGPERSSGIPVL